MGDREQVGVRRSRRFSVWSLVAPVARVVAVAAIVSIVIGSGWLDHAGGNAPTQTTATTQTITTGNGQTVAITIRAKAGETLMDVAVRYGLSLDALHELNPKLSTTAALPTGRKIRLR
jgi:LysM repeat protein